MKFLFENPSRTFFDKIKTIALSYLIILLWLFGVHIFLSRMDLRDDIDYHKYVPFYDFFFACIFAPLWEELVYRYAAISILKKLGQEFIVPGVIISSAIFGWGHHYGPISLLIQGVGGLIFSYTYIKNNYSYWSSVLLHFLWNFSVGYLIPILAQ